MHEMSYMIRFLNMAEEALSEEPKETSVEEIIVEVGEMTGVMPEYLEKYFPKAAEGTRFSTSKLVVESIPAATECASCKTEYHPAKENGYRCPNCQSTQGRIIHGRELNLKALKLK